MFCGEASAHQDTKDCDGSEEYDQREVGAAGDIADAEKFTADDEIRERPHDIGGGRGKALAGGFAKGVGKRSPQMPLTKCGTTLVRKMPEKKQAM